MGSNGRLSRADHRILLSDTGMGLHLVCNNIKAATPNSRLVVLHSRPALFLACQKVYNDCQDRDTRSSMSIPKSLRENLSSDGQTTRAAFGTQLRNFYGGLVLLEILNPVRADRHHLELVGPGFRQRKHDWHRFLDYLSMLADYESGGNTISSIAVQNMELERPKYWMVTHSDREERASAHIKWILCELQATNPLSGSELQSLSTRISERSVQLGGHKVAQFRRRLHDFVERAGESLSSHKNVRPDQGTQIRNITRKMPLLISLYRRCPVNQPSRINIAPRKEQS